MLENTGSIILRRILLIVVATWLVWRILAVSLATHYAEQLAGDESKAADKALAWDHRQPQALYRRALAVREQDPQTALALLSAAYVQNPASAWPLISAADIALAAGDQERADALVQTAIRLMPADPRIHQQAARYWIERGDLGQALQQWSLTLLADPSRRHQLFALFIALAEDRRTRLAFEPFAVSPPAWWEAFFSEAAKRALRLDSVDTLYHLRREYSPTPITAAERHSYVARLKREGAIPRAYIVWVNGLTREQRQWLGLLYDGGFELEPDNWGFGWHMQTRRGALIERARTYGSDGDKSLHLQFERDHGRFRGGRFQGVFQPLFLDPGTYRLNGRARTDSLQTKGGLQWDLRCLLPQPQRLATSERFLGTNPWRDFGFDFEVPADCSLQELRLVSSGKRAFEHAIDGNAWFDRMAIRRR